MAPNLKQKTRLGRGSLARIGTINNFIAQLPAQTKNKRAAHNRSRFLPEQMPKRYRITE
ncbi:hypothetical protein [Mesorhizobium sp. AA22]|uniref:hypothetical protein n=1 Tax=Mesorhizobium sp. AA22 TaxID=1854057 RepID=UPI0012EA7D44|nr:hypothetical protein [Mesorhizobium sp. AA22]QIA22660.1 hypothetical protein A9K68_013465 [Mesorhizobium sp. AA22]